MSDRLPQRGTFNCPTLVEGHHYISDPETGCWEWQRGKDGRAGYGRHSSGVAAHRVSYRQFVGEIPAGYDVHHVCRNRGCVNPEHLEAWPRSKHRSMHFREAKSPLSEEKVLELRKRAMAGESLVLLAKEYGITRWTAGDIARGHNWASVGGPIGRPETYCLECGAQLTNRRHAKFCSPGHRSTYNCRRHRARLQEAA